MAQGYVNKSGLPMPLPVDLGGTGQTTPQAAFNAIKQTATDDAGGVLETATQAEQEAGAANDKAVTPGRQQFHPSAAKAWIKIQGVGAVTIFSSYNVSSVTDLGTGQYRVNFTNPMSSGSYAGTTGTIDGVGYLKDFLTTSVTADHANLSGTSTDTGQFTVVVFGDQ